MPLEKSLKQSVRPVQRHTSGTFRQARYDLRAMPAGGNSHPPAHPTIRDVARLAGVARTTASDALQGRGRVSEATRARVEAAAAALRYRPHAGARDLT